MRRSPSDKAKVRVHLTVGSVITLLAPGATNDYVHVKTTEGVQGWVLAQNLREND